MGAERRGPAGAPEEGQVPCRLPARPKANDCKCAHSKHPPADTAIIPTLLTHHQPGEPGANPRPAIGEEDPGW